MRAAWWLRGGCRFHSTGSQRGMSLDAMTVTMDQVATERLLISKRHSKSGRNVIVWIVPRH